MTTPTPAAGTGSLADLLVATWQAQARDGFLLSDPDADGAETRTARDPVSGVTFRYRWLPHRELRTNTTELERRGILNPDRDPHRLFRDPRDSSGRHCFLCIENIEICHPMEVLVPMNLAGRPYVAGANFAWIDRNHYTVMSEEHIDQDFTPHVLTAMLQLHEEAEGRFRVLYNGAQAGATIPWHLHYQITTGRLPVESLAPGGEASYPASLRRFDRDAIDDALGYIERWVGADRRHRVNLLVAGPADSPVIHVFARDTRKTHAVEKGLMGGFEICGDLIYSEPDKRSQFEAASLEMARRVIAEVRPDAA